jgi:hypothetical protein
MVLHKKLMKKPWPTRAVSKNDFKIEQMDWVKPCSWFNQK